MKRSLSSVKKDSYNPTYSLTNYKANKLREEYKNSKTKTKFELKTQS